jgi:mRNA-degrading endonuclease toxin of MazEF toxin-antitoxin module
MIINRGEIWLAELNPIRGSEQAGMRPVLILQNNSINRFTSTINCESATSFTTYLCPLTRRRRQIG